MTMDSIKDTFMAALRGGAEGLYRSGTTLARKALKALDLNEQELKDTAMEIKEKIMKGMDHGAKMSLEFTFMSIPPGVKVALLSHFTMEEAAKLAGVSDDLKKIVMYYGPLAQVKSTMVELKTVERLKGFCWTNSIDAKDLEAYPEDAPLVAIENVQAKTVSFYLAGFRPINLNDKPIIVIASEVLLKEHLKVK